MTIDELDIIIESVIKGPKFKELARENSTLRYFKHKQKKKENTLKQKINFLRKFGFNPQIDIIL